MSVRVPTSLALAGATLIAGALGACDRHGVHLGTDSARIVDTIKSGEVRWNADWRAGDAARIASHYAPDAVVMTPGAPPTVGAVAIHARLEQVTAQPGLSVTFASDRVEVAKSGELAISRGAYKLVGPDPRTGAEVTETGSYVTLYKPGPDGVWRAVWDINTPASTAAPRAAAAP